MKKFILGVLYLVFLSTFVIPSAIASRGSFIFPNAQVDPNKPIRVLYFKPTGLTDTSPVLFVMHGSSRNARGYRKAWIPFANQYNFLLVVPEFTREHFPGGPEYNRGNMFRRGEEALQSRKVEESKWTFSMIEPLFDFVKQMTGNKSNRYYIYGHSAGGQFVHRLLLFKSDLRIRKAVAANAGWYTMPTFKDKYPYGLKGSGATPDQLKKIFGKKVTILLGEDDTDEQHRKLRKTPKAMAQGKHRLERGITFFKTAKATATEIGAQFRWELKKAPDVGHSNRQMAPWAADVLFGSESR